MVWRALFAVCVVLVLPPVAGEEDEQMDLEVVTEVVSMDSRSAMVLNHVNTLPGGGTPNHNPLFDAGPSITVVEDSGIYGPRPWATNIVDGDGPLDALLRPTDSGRQSVRFVVVAQQAYLFDGPAGQPQVTNQGFLTFTPAPDQCGVTSVTVELRDDGNPACVDGAPAGAPLFVCPGACQPADCSVSVEVQFTITIVCVNDPPRFTDLGDQTSTEDAGLITVNNWAFNVNKGAGDSRTAITNFELEQLLTFSVSIVSGAELFSVGPQILWNSLDPTTADLTYQTAPGACGIAVIAVGLTDNGGTANGGSDTMVPERTFQITIECDNDPPSFTCGDAVVIDEDFGPYTQSNWATQISKGNGFNDGNENAQQLFFDLEFANPGDANLFLTPPRIDPATGTLQFEAKADANTGGRNVELYVRLRDDGGMAPRDRSCDPISACCKLLIVINPINDPPSFTCGPDIIICEDLMNLPVTPTPPIYTDGTNWARNINIGAVNEGIGLGQEGQQLVFTLTNTNQGMFVRQPSLDSAGTLTFELQPNANGVAVVTVNSADTGSVGPPGSNQGPTCQFTITVLPVSDAPTFTLPATQPLIVHEDDPPSLTDFPTFMTNINRGPLDEAGQVISLSVENSNTALFTVQPRLEMISTNTARLAFELAPDMCGQAILHITVADDGDIQQCNGKGQSTTTANYTIKVECENDPPSFHLGPVCCAKKTTCTGDVCAIILCEDDAVNGYTQTGFATNIVPGPDKFDENDQTVAFIVNTDNSQLFSTPPSISPSGTLTFTTAKDMYGDATMSVSLVDSGVPPRSSEVQQYVINVRPSNDPPVFSIRGDLIGTSVLECVVPYEPRGCSFLSNAPGCARTFPSWIYDAAPGPTNEALQGMTFKVEVGNAADDLFTVLPTIDMSGTLSFTLKPGAVTSSPITLIITATDDGNSIQGGVMNGQATCPGSDTTVQTLQFEIMNVNNPPCFTCGTTKEVLEDSGPATFLSAVTDIIAGPPDESTQTLTFNLVPDKPFLFSDPPKIDPTSGSLTFTPGPDQCGSTVVSVQLDDGQPSDNLATCQMTINIVPVNDKPSFTNVGEVTVNEDVGPTCSQWVKVATAGHLEDFDQGTCARQTVSYEVQVSSTTEDLFLVSPTISSTGVLCFHPNPDYCGTATVDVVMVDSGGVTHSGVDRSDKETFTIVVACINDAPSFNKGNDLVVCEDGGPQLAPNWCTGQIPGPLINENCAPKNQILTFNVVASRPELFVIQPKIDRDTCSLSFTPAANANGVSDVTITLCDNGASVPPNVNCAAPEVFTINIKAINDQPTFRKGADVSVLEDVPPQFLPAWAKDISRGPTLDPGSENAMTLEFILTAEDPSLFSVQPAVNPANGDLTFTLAPNANTDTGSTRVNICLKDNGGTFITSRNAVALQSNPGTTSCPNGVDILCDVFRITIKPCNDPPQYLQAPDVTVSEDSGLQELNHWMQQLAPGPDDERHQILKVVQLITPADKTHLFTKLPTLAQGDNGILSFTPAPNAYGRATITIVLQDNGGTDDNCIDTARKTFDIIINNVNDVPTFTRGPHVVVNEDVAPYAAPWATDISPGPFEETQPVNFIVTAAIPGLFSVQPAISPEGVLTFTPAPNANGLTTVAISLTDTEATSAVILATIEILPVNDPPTFDKGNDVSVMEDSPPTCLQGWATRITPGPDNEQGQTVQFVLTPRTPVLFISPPTLDPTSGDLCFTLAPNVNGDVLVDIVASDSGGIANGGVNTALPIQFMMHITPVNDPPFYLKGPDITVLEDSPDLIFEGWASQMTAGPYESTQTYVFATLNTDIQLFSVPPKVWENTGDLVFTLAPNRNGETRVDLGISDNGGTANGGLMSYTNFFYITIRPVNDRPLFTIGTDIQVLQIIFLSILVWLYRARVYTQKDPRSTQFTPNF